ncbi:MAG: HlyD family efflux transporter periplasmic adaptor subunit [Xanthomonadales bacterium]|nr:HlyD family efflux transporter periplasmic adaptor subunit [Xanthomonadales bacterium]MCC6595162.1 efflux RND transporter periplasmic adaptor subunit [Rhodanobacteraceae bacterium]MDL1869120.1 HlyD family efflux transporter periplasmic adaptor subunit [Gammaproteobacteria bacterium PRO6]
MSDSSNANGGNRKRRGLMLAITLVFVLAGAAWYLLWLLVWSQREVTDDAYVNGNQVIVSAQVPGTVVAILADDTQRVEAGQVLVRLDPTDTELALAKASSALAHAVRQVRQLTESAGQADTAVAARELDFKRAQADLARRTPLLAANAVSPEEVAHARDAVRLAGSALQAAQRQAAAAHALVDGSDVAGNPAVLQARAAFREAWVHARRNEILAPISGYVAQRNVQVGNRVQPGQPLLTLIALDDLWIDANFKESQLANIRIGQDAHIESDIYGGKVAYRGKVVGLGAGTGSAFALLPPQNASGNWIKVVQRVPVRIALDTAQLARHPLRIGLSTTVKVDTHERNGAMLASTASEAVVARTDVYTRDLAKADAAADAIIAANLPATH